MKGINTQKGITLVALAVMIAVLSLISGVGLYLGKEAITQTKDSKLSAELNMVQHAVLEQYTKYKTTRDIDNLVGQKMDTEEVQTIASRIGVSLVNIPNTYSNADYYKLNKQSLEKIGITNSEDEYIVNYVSGEVINITLEKDNSNNPLYVKANSFINN